MNHMNLNQFWIMYYSLLTKIRDRKAGRVPKWQPLEDIVKKMKGFAQTTNVCAGLNIC